MKPDNSVIASVSGKLSARVLARRGKAYAIYLHVPLPKKPKRMSDYLRPNARATLVLDLPRGTYRAEWVDTKTGKTAGTEKFIHPGGRRKLASPVFANDIALRVVAERG